jgi:hypothetical protein
MQLPRTSHPCNAQRVRRHWHMPWEFSALLRHVEEPSLQARRDRDTCAAGADAATLALIFASGCSCEEPSLPMAEF